MVVADFNNDQKIDIGKRLKGLRESKDLTQKDICDLMGLKQVSSVSEYESGKKLPRPMELYSLAKFYNVTVEWIMTGKDSPTSVTVPLLGKIRCGVPLLDVSNWDEQIEVPDGIKADFAARAEGDSMIYAGICSGDIILFRENADPYNGQVVATRHVNETEGVNLKYLIKKGDQAFLRSANPAYEDIELNGNHKIIGVMSGLIREEAPTLHEYKSMLSVKSDVEDRWTETIALAAAHGITPEAIQNMINMHVTMAFNLAKKK